jgi:hypothetical protein
MSNTFFSLAVDCHDAAVLARFWGEVLGREVGEDPTPEEAVLEPDPDSVHGPRVVFHRVPEAKTVKNRLHFDLISAEFETETQRLVGLGARPLRDVESGLARWTTFADIEGNEFDLIAV